MTTVATTQRLDGLSDEEFRDEMKEAMWRDAQWAPFMEPEIVDRSLEELNLFVANLTGQLAQYKDADKEWAGRARRYLTQSSARYSQVRRRIRNLNRQESAEMEAYERKWGEFAYRLACALEGSDADHKLDEVLLRDELPAREWLAARRAQRLKKGRDI